MPGCQPKILHAEKSRFVCGLVLLGDFGVGDCEHRRGNSDKQSRSVCAGMGKRGGITSIRFGPPGTNRRSSERLTVGSRPWELTQFINATTVPSRRLSLSFSSTGHAGKVSTRCIDGGNKSFRE